MTEAGQSSGSDSALGAVPWRRIGRIVGLLVLLAVVVPFVVYAVPQVAGADQSYVVLSGSMEPAMSPGDVILVDGTEAAAIQEGDVITFKRGAESTPTTHRVIDVVEQDNGVAFETKGDANEDPDAQLVTPSQVEGEVQTVGGYLLVIPYIGYVIQFMQTTVGFVALFVVPIVLLIVSELWNVVASSNGEETDAGDSTESTAPDAASAEATADSSAANDEAESTAAPREQEADDGQLTFSALELQLGLAALGAFLAYSLWVVYATIEIFESGLIWASGVAAAVAVAFLLFLGLYVSGRRNASDDETARQTDATATAADGGEDTVDSPEPDSSADGEEFDWASGTSRTEGSGTAARVDGDASGGEDDD
jgi:signal peptidase